MRYPKMKCSTIFNLCLFLFYSLPFAGNEAQHSDSTSALMPINYVTIRSSPRIDGWSEQIGKYRFFKAKELYSFIGGDAAKYENQGLIDGIKVTLANDTNKEKEINIYFENYLSIIGAKEMVSVKKNLTINVQPFSEIKDISCYYSQTVGGCVAFWSCRQYYIELSIKGYGSFQEALYDSEICIYSIIAALGE